MHHLGVGIDSYSPPYLIHIQVTLEKKREVPFLLHIYTFRPRYTLASGDRMKMRKLLLIIYTLVYCGKCSQDRTGEEMEASGLWGLYHRHSIVEPIRSSLYKQLSLSRLHTAQDVSSTY